MSSGWELEKLTTTTTTTDNRQPTNFDRKSSLRRLRWDERGRKVQKYQKYNYAHADWIISDKFVWLWILYAIVFHRRYNFILFFDASCGFLTDVIIILLYSDSFTVSLNIKDSHFSTSRNKASYIVCCLSCLAVLLYFWIMQVYALFNLMKKKSKRKTSYFKDAIAWYSRRHFCKLGVIFSSTCYLFTGFN